MFRILKQTHFEGCQCSKNRAILKVTCGKHTHIEGPFPVVLKQTSMNLIGIFVYSYKDLYILYKCDRSL